MPNKTLLEIYNGGAGLAAPLSGNEWMYGVQGGVDVVVTPALMRIYGFGEKLTASRTYYVRPDGSDLNNGLANTAGGAWQTIMRAVAAVMALDLNFDKNIQVEIRVADGTYAEALQLGNLRNPAQNEDTTTFPNSTDRKCVAIIGNEVTPDNVVISPGALGGPVVVEGLTAQWRLSGIKTMVTVAGATTRDSITARNGAYVVLRHISDVNTAGTGQFLVALHAEIRVMDNANIKIEGSRQRCVFATYFSHIFFRPTTLEFVNGPVNFSIGLFQASDNSFTEVVFINGNASVTGTATGKMLIAEYNSHVTSSWKLAVGDFLNNYCDGSSSLSDGFPFFGGNVFNAPVGPASERFVPPQAGGIYVDSVKGEVAYFYNRAGNYHRLILPPVSVPPPRRRLTANEIYYVREDGNDANDGLSDTAGGAWRQVNHAFNWIANNLDFQGFDIRLNIGNSVSMYDPIGNYTDFVGGGRLQIYGESAAGVKINFGIYTQQDWFCGTFCNWNFIQLVGNGFDMIINDGGLQHTFNDCTFTMTPGFSVAYVDGPGFVAIEDCKFVGTGKAALRLFGNKVTGMLRGSNDWNGCTFETACVIADRGYATVSSAGINSFTGKRFEIDNGGVVNGFGAGGLSALPGTIAGTVKRGGIYQYNDGAGNTAQLFANEPGKFTVGTLPTASDIGQSHVVTDALSPAIGSVVAGGGAAKALVWWNGAQWTVTGI